LGAISQNEFTSLARETTDKATSLFSLHQVILEQEEDKNNIALSQLHKLTAAAAATCFHTNCVNLLS